MSIFREMGWQGAVDIAVLTLLAFQVYLWLRGTVALQVLGGLVAILGASVAVDSIGLAMTGHVLQAVGAVGAVLIVVIFRDEIRLGLRRADPVQWARRRWRSNNGDIGRHGELARAIARLSEGRLGALLVVPRYDAVDQHISGGTHVDAAISAEMVEALFHTSSPLHDGAAVIQGDRVRTAGAVLPLSTSVELPSHLGTRHRAAVGLSEECDALVVAVSEERGTISLISHGSMTTAPREPEELAAVIGRELGRSPGQLARGGRDRRWRWREVVAFFVILVAVAGAWSVVMGGRRVVVTTTAPIEMRDLPDDYRAEIVRPRSGNARLRVRGPRWLLGEERLSEVRVWVELHGVEPGWRRFELRVDAPSGLEIVDRDPSTAAVEIEKTK